MLSGVAGISVVAKGSPGGVVSISRSLRPARVFSHQMIAVMLPSQAFLNSVVATCSFAIGRPAFNSLR